MPNTCPSSSVWFAGLVWSLIQLSSAVETSLANHAPIGGGTTRAGLSGAYFANPDFAGKPAFTRRDVRIDFDWKEGVAGKGLPVGGATTPGMADFPLDEFAIRWTGQIVPRFSEDYTLRITGKDGVRFTCAGKVLIDSLGAGVVKEVGTGPLTAGQAYDIVFEYVDRAGTNASEARLEWSSPSTPWEVIEPLSYAQICGHQASPGSWLSGERADLKRESVGWKSLTDPDWKKGKALVAGEMDDDGWPTVPGFLVELNHQYQGRHMVRFQGKANVEVGSYWFGGNLKVAWNTAADGSGQALDKANSKGPHGMAMLPKGAGYSEKDDTTTAWFDLGAVPTGLMLLFTEAERVPGQPGITRLLVMAPVSEGATEHHQPGEILKREARETFTNFTVNRLHIGMSQNKGATWKERTLPGYHAREHAAGWGYCLEEYIMLVNESGMDWHLCFGAGWDEEFMRKFAQLVRYGSDGVEPYDHYVESPKYPPLNPNLRIYLEHSNELPWAVYPQFIWDDLRRKAAEGHPDWKIVNYDGKCASVDHTAMYRYHALRMRQMSQAFRSVYQDVPGAIGDRARVYCFGQYDGAAMNNMLQFLDNYFNKADPASTFAGTPHPPSHDLWGGGGAIYYGCSNKFGLTAKEELPDGGFEAFDVPTGTAALRPESAGWTFTGNAGICDVRLASPPAATVTAMPAEPAPIPEKDVWIGCKFTVGDKDLFVSKLGRWMGKGQTGTNFWASPALNMAIVDAEGAQVGGFQTAHRLSTFATDQFGYEWCSSKAGGATKALQAYLQAGKTYYLVSREKGGSKADRFFGPVEVAAAPGITITAAVTGPDFKTWSETPGSLAFGPVNMLFTSERLRTAEGDVGVPPDSSEIEFVVPWAKEGRKPDFPYGTQCAFLQGTSGMSRGLTVEKAGAYWITFSTALDRTSNGYKKQGWGGWTVTAGGNSVRVLVDGVDVTPTLLPIGGFESRFEPFHYSSTRVFRLEPGAHTVAFERVKPGAGTIFIDEVHLSSEEAFYGGPTSPNFPAGGNAFGQNAATGYHKTAQAECEMARNWGLVPCTYEGGWAVQGDFDHYSMLAWNDLRYGSAATNQELTKQALRNAFDIWCRNGGFVYAYFYPVQKSISQRDAPLLRCVQEMNDRLPAAPAAGITLPGELTPETPHSQGGATQNYAASWSAKKTPADLPAQAWKSWIVTAPGTETYTITLQGEGGTAELRVDDVVLAQGAVAGGLNGSIRLLAGVHAIKVQAGAEAVKIGKVLIAK